MARRHEIDCDATEIALQLSLGKQRGLQALANEHGVIAALAIDQRSALRALFAKASGQSEEDVPVEPLIQFKEHVSRILTPHASAILLDPEIGLSAAAKRDKNTGLLLAYEKSGYDKGVRGRFPSLLDGFSVTRLKQAGADSIKVLLYYSPFSEGYINERKHAWVERVGAECLAGDVPFFLELVSYNEDMDEKGADFAKIKPDVVTRSVEQFCKRQYAVDVLKVGVPVNLKFVESAALPRSLALYTRDEAKVHFRRASQAASLPFIYLSEGVTNEMFADALAIAAEAGSAFSGVLCGRAIWQDGVSIFVKHGATALDEWLSGAGIDNMQKVNAGLAAARPWFEHFAATSSGKG